jgi:DNA-binding transcriptional MerR regulator
VTKGPQAFRTISEASDELGVPQHVLRFWETKFSFIRPMKRAGGRRFYRPQDLEVLKGVRALLHDDGYTIKGVQRLHKEQGVKRLLAAVGGDEDPMPHAGVSAHDDGQSQLFPDHYPAPAPHAKPLAASRPPPIDAEAEQGLLEALDALQAAKARLNKLLGD